MRHARAGLVLGMEVGVPFDRGRGGPGGWWIVFEPEPHPGADIVVPDLAGWRRATMPEYPDAACCGTAPDWVCGVLSPPTRRIDRNGKRAVHAREGVPHPWSVDPDARTLEVFRPRGGGWLLLETLSDGAEVSRPPFGAVSFPLAALWPEGAGRRGWDRGPSRGALPSGSARGSPVVSCAGQFPRPCAGRQDRLPR